MNRRKTPGWETGAYPAWKWSIGKSKGEMDEFIGIGRT
jgi:hypothetical protein